LKIYFFVLIFFAVSGVFAGGDSGVARITSMKYHAGGALVFEITWLDSSNFGTGKIDNFRFEYQNWPSNSHVWLKKIVPWSGFDDNYSKEKFEACANQMILAYKLEKPVRIGKMGTVDFQRYADNREELIVPFAELSKEHGSNEEICFLYSAPI
jgi:hypothetical protein